MVDVATVRRFAEAHADAVVRGDRAALDDFSAEAMPLVKTLTRALPHPVTAAEIIRLEPHGATTLVDIRYDGGPGNRRHVVVRSEWAGDERPCICRVTLTGGI